MDHNLEVAVDIADVVSDVREKLIPLDVQSVASQLTERHDGPGLSSDDVAAALKDENRSAGVTTQEPNS